MTAARPAAACVRPAGRAAVISLCALAGICASWSARAQVRQDPAAVYVTASPSNRSTWVHDVKPGVDRYAVVAITLGQIMGELASVSSIGFGGAPMAHLGDVANGAQVKVELWGLANPAVGMQPVEVQLTRNAALVAGSVSFTGVDPQGPTGAVATQIGASTTASLTIASAAGEEVLDVYGSPEGVPAPASGQTSNWIDRNGVSGACSSRPGVTTTTMAWDRGGGSAWALAAVTLRPRRSPFDGGAGSDAAPLADGAAGAGVDGRGGGAGSGDGEAATGGDAGRKVEFQMGCSCRVAERGSSWAPPLVVLLLFWPSAWARRRRRRWPRGSRGAGAPSSKTRSCRFRTRAGSYLEDHGGKT